MELIMLFLALSSVLLVLYLVWFIFFADTDFALARAEKFGRPLTVYRQKVIWVTGASSGLGEAMAYELASVGAKLILTARNKTLLQQVKQKCLEMAQGKLDNRDVLVLPFDITDQEVHKSMVNDVLKHFGEINVLINNAGRFQIGRIENTACEVDKDMFEVNFFGPINLTKLVVKHFLERRNGHIVVISSVTGKCASPGIASYSSTKHALHAYYESLRMEYFKDNIKITVVCPSFFESQMGCNVMSAKKGEIMNNVTHCGFEMTTSRCAYLTLVAAANELHEAWIAYQPFLSIEWCGQYMPGILRLFLNWYFTEQRVQNICEGRFPNDVPLWKPFLR